DRGSGRPERRRGLDVREPGWSDRRALVPRGGLPALADGSPRYERRRRPRDQLMGSLAERSIELHLRDDVRFGVGALDQLPGMTAAADPAAGPGGPARAFIVTDDGVRRSGRLARVRAG